MEPIVKSGVFRKEFIIQQKGEGEYRKIDANERIQKLMSQQTSGYVDNKYNEGDEVLFMEPGNNKWSGPAKVTGVEGTKVRIIHCGYDRTVPNCCVQPYKIEKIIVENPESNIDTVEISEKYNINKTKDDGECKEELKSPQPLIAFFKFPDFLLASFLNALKS